MGELDMDAAVADIGASLGFGADEPKEVIADADKPVVAKVETAEVTKPEAKEPIDPAAKTVVDPTKPVVTDPAVRAAPASFPKDKASVWAAMPAEAQDFYLLREEQMLKGLDQYKEHNAFGKQMRDTYAPYKAMLNAQGIDEAKATQYLLNAHYRLTNGTADQRKAAYDQLGVSMGLVAAGEQKEIDPAVRELQERLARTEGALNQKAQREYTEAQTRVSAEVNTFAKENPYFDEVSEDIVKFIEAAHARGEKPDLKSIYDQVVWANPVTRQKELARTQQETEKALREKSAQEAEAARKASSTNVRGRDTRRAPTEPTGTMEDTMRDTLKTIRNRAH